MSDVKKSFFIRRLGCLVIHTLRLEKLLTASDIEMLEREAQEVQDLVLELIKAQRKLSKIDQDAIRLRFTDQRRKALELLEQARHLLSEPADFVLQQLTEIQKQSA